MSQEPMTDAERDKRIAQIRERTANFHPDGPVGFLLSEIDRLNKELADYRKNHIDAIAKRARAVRLESALDGEEGS